MNLGPYLVVRGAVAGSILMIFLCLLTSADLQTTTASALAQAQRSSASQMDASGLEDCQVSQSYPPQVYQWCQIITRSAQAQGLDPDLVAAIILQESGGDPMAYSHSGAVGLMQVMPRDGLAATFQCINGPCFASRPTIQELQDATYNIEYGTRFLASLVANYGSLREALRAYGPQDAGYRYADIVLGIYRRTK